MFKHKFKLNPIALSFKLNQEANGRIQLFPFGWFEAQDGRGGRWYVGDENGYALADDINNTAIDLMIDYEHQTLYIARTAKATLLRVGLPRRNISRAKACLRMLSGHHKRPKRLKTAFIAISRHCF